MEKDIRELLAIFDQIMDKKNYLCEREHRDQDTKVVKTEAGYFIGQSTEHDHGIHETTAHTIDWNNPTAYKYDCINDIYAPAVANVNQTTGYSRTTLVRRNKRNNTVLVDDETSVDNQVVAKSYLSYDELTGDPFVRHQNGKPDISHNALKEILAVIKYALTHAQDATQEAFIENFNTTTKEESTNVDKREQKTGE